MNRLQNLKINELQVSAFLKSLEGFFVGIILALVPHISEIAAGHYVINWGNVAIAAVTGALCLAVSRLLLFNDTSLAPVFDKLATQTQDEAKSDIEAGIDISKQKK